MRKQRTAPAGDLERSRDSAGVRVLIVSASIGEGHDAAARAVEAQLAAAGGFEAVRADGLAVFGPVTRWAIRDGYRLQLRVAPWAYALSYRVFVGSPLFRGAGERVLAISARRRLRALLEVQRPDLILSTHPALTAVLGRSRRAQRITVPLTASITDLADYSIWAHPGVDAHLVLHASAIEPVERRAGRPTAVLARPLVSPAFTAPLDIDGVRRGHGLPATGIIVVSGGGWGVGDLDGAARSAVDAGAALVLVLAGRNDAVRSRLEQRYVDHPRVRVLGFTAEMPELLRCADVLVHSTGGMTSIEGLVSGCHVVAYGSDIGHIAVHNAAMHDLGLVTWVRDLRELPSVLADALSRADAPTLPNVTTTAASTLADLHTSTAGAAAPAQRRAWKPAAARIAIACAVGSSVIAGAHGPTRNDLAHDGARLVAVVDRDEHDHSDKTLTVGLPSSTAAAPATTAVPIHTPTP